MFIITKIKSFCPKKRGKGYIFAYFITIASDSLHLTSGTLLTPISGVVLQWRNRLARRTYKQYKVAFCKQCGGCEFEPHLEQRQFLYILFSVQGAITQWINGCSQLVSLVLHSLHASQSQLGSTKSTCPGWGSNSRPSDFSLVNLDYETDALPTALPRPL